VSAVCLVEMVNKLIGHVLYNKIIFLILMARSVHRIASSKLPSQNERLIVCMWSREPLKVHIALIQI
jgi:hypothetical protein